MRWVARFRLSADIARRRAGRERLRSCLTFGHLAMAGWTFRRFGRISRSMPRSTSMRTILSCRRPCLSGASTKATRRWICTSCAAASAQRQPPPWALTKTPRVPVTTTRPAPSAPPTTTTAAPVTTTTTPNPPPTTTTTTEQQLPDLVVRKLSLDGSTLVWNIEIRNRGNGDAPASKTGLTQPTGSDERQIDTPPIKAGDSVTVTAQCPFGTIGKAKARADANNDVTESDEGNNNSDQVTGGIQGGDGESRCRFP